MNKNKILYLITDSSDLSEEDFLSKIELACQNGVDLVQLREKSKTNREILEIGFKVKSLTDKYNIPLIIDDKVDLALALDCAGVHLGQDDLAVNHARTLLGPNKIIGATAKSLVQAREAEEMGADYLGVGAIFPTTSKVKTQLTKIETLREIVENVKIPVYAIGGLNYENLDILKSTSVNGICLISAIMQAEDVGKTTRDLKNKINEVL